MTPVPFFLVPLGLVLGWLLSWLRGSGTRRRLRDARIVFLAYLKSMDNYEPREGTVSTLATFYRDMHRALSGKERK